MWTSRQTAWLIFTVWPSRCPSRSTQLQSLARLDLDTVINEEWRQMAKGEVPEKGTSINAEMWRTVISVKAASPTEVNAQEHAMSEVSSVAQHRQTRIRQSTTQLPNVL